MKETKEDTIVPTTFFERLLEAQKEIGAVAKSKENPFFKSKYADINVILSVVKPVLNSKGLVLTQPTVIIDGRNMLETIVSDAKTGEQIKSVMFIPEGADIQKFGASITYLRRFELQSLLALEAQDDDGNTATGKKYSIEGKQTPNKAVYDKKGVLVPSSLSDADDPFID